VRVVECRSCGAPMFWVTTAKGKKMPLDSEPVSNGAFVLDGDPLESGEQKVKHIGERSEYRGERFSSHFSTCPDADKHRKA